MGTAMKGLLLSGGVDSICSAYNLKPEYAFTIDYGQAPAEREIFVSGVICEIMGITHRVIRVDCSDVGSGILAQRKPLDLAPSREWWPYRNQMLITLCLMQCIKLGISELHLASVKSDSFHKDGTLEFYQLISQLVEYQEGGIRIKCDTLDKFSHELVLDYDVPLEFIQLAHSCHTSNISCGSCPGCTKLIRVREELGIE